MGYEKLGLQQLRELCDAFGLATDGKKAELVARIESKAVANVADAAAATAAAAADPVEGSRAPAAAPRAQCPVKREAEAFLQTLGIDGVYFKRDQDRCYCSQCYPARFPDTIPNEGPTEYVVPRGWYRFGLAFGGESKARSGEHTDL